MSHSLVSRPSVLNLPLPLNFGLFFVFFLGDLLQLFQEDRPNTHTSFFCYVQSVIFSPKLSLICTSLFVNEIFYFQMSMISLDIKKIKFWLQNECVLVFY